MHHRARGRLGDRSLVDIRQDSQRHWYALNAAPLFEIERWLEPFRAQMEARYEPLDALLEVLKEEPEDDEASRDR